MKEDEEAFDKAVANDGPFSRDSKDELWEKKEATRAVVKQVKEEMKVLEIAKPNQPTLEATAPVKPQPSSYEMQSVGRVALTLMKKTDARWKGLHSDPTLKLGDQQIWWDLYDKYESELGSSESEPAKETQKKQKKKTKKGGKKASQKDEL